jgi:anaerobic sulfite reductase subunit B
MDNIYAATTCKVIDVTSHTDTERSFTLESKIQASPGQFVMVSLPHAGEVPIAISALGVDTIDITVRNAGKVTSSLFRLRPGDDIFLRGPYGQGFPLDVFEGQHLLVIAGGSGLAAVKPLISNYLQNSDQHRLKQLDVLVGFKSPKHILFKGDLKYWNRNCDVIVTVDAHEDETESWAGGIGFVVDFIKAIRNIGPDTFAVVIGPPRMMSNSVKELLRHQVMEERIWVSFERHMQCGVGKCGHCRIRDRYVCVDGPVFSYAEAKELID